jgi:uncharacterized membrane protein YfhO
LVADDHLAAAEDVSSPDPASFRGSAVLRARLPDRLVVDVDASAPGHVVVVEAYAAGWQATVDGAPAPVWRANVLFRAVPVPAGRHEVEMRYRPPSVWWGAVLSAIGVAAAVGLARRRPQGATRSNTR